MAYSRIVHRRDSRTAHPTRDPLLSQPGLFWLPAALTTLLGVLLSFVALRPGTMSRDSFVMYGMGVNWQFNDWHHPYVPVLMALSRAATGDTSLLLFFQLASFWMGMYLFAVSLRLRIGAWALLSFMVGFTPVVLSQCGFLHKTPLQTSLFFLAFGVCYYYHSVRQRPSLRVLPFLLVALFVGSAVRGYSYLSAIPLLLFLGHLLFGGKTMSSAGLKAASFTLAALGLFLTADHFIVYRLLGARKTLKVQTIFKYDLAGIMARSGMLYGTRVLRSEYSTPEAIAKRYQGADGMYPAATVFRSVTDRAELDYLFRQWLLAISEQPMAYVKHRQHAIARSFGIGTPRMSTLRTEATFSYRVNEYGLKKDTNALWGLLSLYVAVFHGTLLYEPWFWFASNIMVLALAVALLLRTQTSRDAIPHLTLLSSGTVFFLIYLPICLVGDLRFVYWGIVSTAFGALGVAATIATSLAERWRALHGA